MRGHICAISHSNRYFEIELQIGEIPPMCASIWEPGIFPHVEIPMGKKTPRSVTQVSYNYILVSLMELSVFRATRYAMYSSGSVQGSQFRLHIRVTYTSY